MGKKSESDDLDKRLRAFEKQQAPAETARLEQEAEKDRKELQRDLDGLFGGGKKRRKNK